MSRHVTSITTVESLKREAKRWLKALRAGVPDARARLVRACSDAPAEPGLRDVQRALAREHGLAGWTALTEAVAAQKEVSVGPTTYVPRMSAILSRWFTSYDEARASREAEGGYLLPFKNQFFVTTTEAIRELGLDPNDPDWEKTGWDWVRPRDRMAWERLAGRRRSVENVVGLKEPSQQARVKGGGSDVAPS